MDVNENREGAVALDHSPPAGDVAGARHEVQVTTRVLPAGAEARFKLPENAALREVLEEGARRAGVPLLPPSPLMPLDRLHDILKHDQVGPAIDDLDQPLGPYLKEKGATKDFGIELVLAFRVNTRWAVATKPQMTPREILALPGINLDPAQYTLYPPESAKLLPLDDPITITRGMALEAQRDGKYGGCP
jgi:hypothetical protein